MKADIPGYHEPIIGPDGKLTGPWYRFLRDLHERTGGSDDLVESATNQAVAAQASANAVAANAGMIGGGGGETENTASNSSSTDSDLVITPTSASADIRFSGSGSIRIAGGATFTGETLTLDIKRGVTTLATQTITTNASLSGTPSEPDFVSYNFSFTEYDMPGVTTATTYSIEASLTGGHSVTVSLRALSLTATELT